MENQYDYYSTFVFYDERGRRLSIFGEDNGDNTMDITVIPCALKDEFTKKIGRKMYEDGTWKGGEMHTIEFEEGFPRKSFMNFCRKNYFQVSKTFVTIPIEVYTKGGRIPLSGIGEGEDYLGEKY